MKTYPAPDTTCLHCRHFRFHAYRRPYSEETPGSDAGISCAKGVYSHELYDIDEKTYRATLIDGPQRCGMFERRLAK